MEENSIRNYLVGNAQKRKASDVDPPPGPYRKSADVDSKSRKDILRKQAARQDVLQRFERDGIVYDDKTGTWGCTVCAAGLPEGRRSRSSFARYLATPKQAGDVRIHIMSKEHQASSESLQHVRRLRDDASPLQPLSRSFSDKEERVMAMALGYTLTNSSFRQWSRLMEAMQCVFSEAQGVPRSEKALWKRLHAAATVQWDELVAQLGSATARAVMLDEAQDSSGKAVLSMYLTYITSRSQLCTRFLCLRELEGKDAKSIFATATEALAAVKLKWTDISALTTDGAAVLQGARGGMVAMAREENPLILTTHYCSRCTHLAVVKAAKEDYVLRLLDETLSVLHKALTDSTVIRQDWEKYQKAKRRTHVRLPGHVDTRWSSRASAVEFLYENRVKLVYFFSTATSDNPTCQGLLKEARLKVVSVGFVYTVFWWHAVFSALKPLVQGLQRPHGSYGEVQRTVSDAIAKLKNIGRDREAATTWLQSRVFNTLDWQDGVPYLGTVRLHSQLTKEHDLQAAEEEAMATWVTSSTSVIVSELLGRLPDDDIMECLVIFDPNEYKDGGASMKKSPNSKMVVDCKRNKEKLQQLVRRWCPESKEFSGAEEDAEVNQAMIQIGQDLRDVAQGSQDGNLSIIEFWRPHWERASLPPIFLQCSRILAVMPMSTAECERGFSTMNLVKPAIRNRMITPTLNTLLRLHLDFKGMKMGEAIRHLDTRRAVNLLKHGEGDRDWDGIVTDIYGAPMPQDCGVQEPEEEENDENHP